MHRCKLKRMGEIGMKPFLQTCKRFRHEDKAQITDVELRSLWAEKMTNPEWHGFKVVGVEGNSKHKVL